MEKEYTQADLDRINSGVFVYAISPSDVRHAENSPDPMGVAIRSPSVVIYAASGTVKGLVAHMCSEGDRVLLPGWVSRVPIVPRPPTPATGEPLCEELFEQVLTRLRSRR